MGLDKNYHRSDSLSGNSILIVSASEQFDVVVKKSLKGFITIESKRSGSQARRAALERDYDVVAINAPLPDESGEALALDIAEKSPASVLLVVPAQIYEDVLECVTDAGVLVITKPSPRGRVDKALRFLMALRGRMRQLERKVQSVEEKMEEMRLVTRAKLLLMEKKHMSEDEAHRYIGKQAMDAGVSRGIIASRILEDYD